ncbi:MAG: amidophosphoribosyltransferase, partial [Clostridia bacterium]|nr:amidophosphoribosyltransferase [Clostridia bacterium]
MGGFFGITSKKQCVVDVFFGVDYHSHLGNSRAGMAAVNSTDGFQREIHNVENSPFRTKFDNISSRMKGKACIGCISDLDPQPLLIKSKFGTYAISMVGYVANIDKLVKDYLNGGFGIFQAVSGNRVNSLELIAALIEEKDSLCEGIKYAQDIIEGSCSLLILLENRHLIVARDK